MGTKYLITGSREASAEMLEAAKFVVAQIADNGGELIVGDAPGVDQEAIKAAEQVGIPVIVYAAKECRATVASKTKVILTRRGYRGRDIIMTQIADVVIGVWNGKSRGTQYTVQEAQRIGKECPLLDFGKETRHEDR